MRLGVDQAKASLDDLQPVLHPVEPGALIGKDLQHRTLSRGDLSDLDVKLGDIAANGAQMLKDDVGGLVGHALNVAIPGLERESGLAQR